jgi:hypothetical protein
MHEASADQFADCALGSVFEISAARVSAQHKDQLVHREPARVFIEKKRQDSALGSSVFPCRGRGIERRPTLRVLVSHEELRLLVVRLPVGVTAPPGAASM